MARQNVLKYYKLTWDLGFAPNPFHGFLTLATCKPAIRRTTIPGDWIAGFTAKDIHVDNENAPLHFPIAKLIYLARVDKVVSMADYWVGDEFQVKKPQLLHSKKLTHTKGCGISTPSPKTCSIGASETTKVYNTGDNIYELDNAGNVVQHPNCSHVKEDIPRDISGRNVLICKEFYYFGAENALSIDTMAQLPPVGIGHRVLDLKVDAAAQLINFVKSRYSVGRHDCKN